MITAIPAIDLIGGHIVRLAKGDFSKVTQYGSTPAEIAKEFDALGFKRLHVVDLDAAGRKGRDNIATLREITSATSMKVDFGGGLRSDEAIERAFDAGAIAVSIGSVAIKEPEKAKRWISKYGTERFILSADVLDGEVRKLDVIDCNGRRAVNICSVGIDARIGIDVHRFSRLPLIKGGGAYVVSAGVNFLKGVKQPLRVTCNGKLYSGDMSLICACNGSYYGGGFHPVPEARPDDGVLDFLIVKGVSRAGFVRLVGGYAKGRYASMPKYITHVRGERIDIESETELAVNVDGEAIRGRKISIRLLPGGVNFLVPRGMAFFAAAPATAQA